MQRYSWKRLLCAGLVTGVVDGLFSSVLAAGFYGSTVTRLFQGVASTVLGKSAFDGGATTAVVGVLMHFLVAFFWSALFLVLVNRSALLQRVLASPSGIVKAAVVYGPLVWIMMSCVVIPLLVHRPPTVSARWWIQLVGHAAFVGLPITACITGRTRKLAEHTDPVAL